MDTTDVSKHCGRSFLFLILNICFAQAQDTDINGEIFLEDLKHLANDLLGVQKFQKYVDEQEYSVAPIDGSAEVQKLANELKEEFHRSMGAVEQLRNAIEDTYEHRDTSDSFHFPTCCTMAMGSAVDKRFRKQVNFDNACVLKDDDDTRVLGKGVVDAMKRNLKEIPSIKWQYYGAHDGQFAFYPGFPMCESNFNPRYRPWYVVAATPDPKDVVIVIDTSGSMSHVYGNKQLIETASEAASTVISFLNPNDRVAVVTFSSTAKTPSEPSGIKSCYSEKLAVATHHNKEALKAYLSILEAGGGTKYGPAIEKAFNFFNNSENLETDKIKRDKVILFFTDDAPIDRGGADSILQIIRKRNAQLNNTVVILTYGFGEILQNTSIVLTKMAQQTEYDETAGEVTEGAFRLVTEPNDLIHEMGSFYNFFIKTSRMGSVVFTVPYNDSFGLGLIISACLPVSHNWDLKGVTCVDRALSDILSGVTYFRHGKLSYAFLIDGDGRVMMHPLMPNPYFVNKDPVFLKATTLETADGFEEIIDSMMRGESGSKNLNSIRVKSRGDVDKDGVISYVVGSRYIWAPITKTKFSVCIVIATRDSTTSLIWKQGYPQDFIYHHDFRNQRICSHHNKTVIPEKSSVKFTPEAFINPFEYIEGEDNVELMNMYQRIMTGYINDSKLFKDSVRKNVALSAKLTEFWIQPEEFIIWLYYGSADGIFRSFPAVAQPHGFDHKLRPWYKRTVGQKGLYIWSIPYMDAFGTGLIVTLGHSIHEGKKTGVDAVIGVLAMDFHLNHFYRILLDRFPQCNMKGRECFVLDNSGFIILHKSFFQPGADDYSAQNVHITIKEKYIAQDLLMAKHMRKNNCTDLGNFQIHHTFVISLRGQKKKLVKEKYELHSVPQSNIFLVLKKGIHTTPNCPCYYQLGMWDTKRCSDKPCECPCHTAMDYNRCTENITRSSDDIPTCTAPLPTFNKFGSVKTADPTLPLCRKQKCTEMKSKENCTKLPNCSWCMTDRHGVELRFPLCTDENVCSTSENVNEGSQTTSTILSTSSVSGVITEEYSSSLSNGAIVGICIGVIALITLVIVIVLVIIMKVKKSIKKQQGQNNEAYIDESGADNSTNSPNGPDRAQSTYSQDTASNYSTIRRDDTPPLRRVEREQEMPGAHMELPPPPYSPTPQNNNDSETALFKTGTPYF